MSTIKMDFFILWSHKSLGKHPTYSKTASSLSSTVRGFAGGNPFGTEPKTARNG
jgi:hypothetical protein